MGGLGLQEILLIAAVIFVLFGSKRISGIMKGLGNGIREFTEAKNEVEEDSEETL